VCHQLCGRLCNCCGKSERVHGPLQIAVPLIALQGKAFSQSWLIHLHPSHVHVWCKHACTPAWLGARSEGAAHLSALAINWIELTCAERYYAAGANIDKRLSPRVGHEHLKLHTQNTISAFHCALLNQAHCKAANICQHVAYFESCKNQVRVYILSAT
jgi:hypothetical protein